MAVIYEWYEGWLYTTASKFAKHVTCASNYLLLKSWCGLFNFRTSSVLLFIIVDVFCHLPHLHDVVFRHRTDDPRFIDIPRKIWDLCGMTTMNELKKIQEQTCWTWSWKSFKQKVRIWYNTYQIISQKLRAQIHQRITKAKCVCPAVLHQKHRANKCHFN